MDASDRLEDQYPVQCLLQQRLLGSTLCEWRPYLYCCDIGSENLWCSGCAEKTQVCSDLPEPDCAWQPA